MWLDDVIVEKLIVNMGNKVKRYRTVCKKWKQVIEMYTPFNLLELNSRGDWSKFMHLYYSTDLHTNWRLLNNLKFLKGLKAEGVEIDLHTFPYLEEANFTHCIIHNLKDATSLRHFNVYDCTYNTSDLNRLTKLQTLWVDTDSLTELSNLTNLNTIGIENNRAVNEISRFTNLQFVYLKVSHNHFEPLSQLKKLKVLTILSTTNIDVSAVPSLPSLCELSINGPVGRGDMQQFENIKGLSLMFNVSSVIDGIHKQTRVNRLYVDNVHVRERYSFSPIKSLTMYNSIFPYMVWRSLKFVTYINMDSFSSLTDFIYEAVALRTLHITNMSNSQLLFTEFPNLVKLYVTSAPSYEFDVARLTNTTIKWLEVDGKKVDLE